MNLCFAALLLFAFIAYVEPAGPDTIAHFLSSIREKTRLARYKVFTKPMVERLSEEDRAMHFKYVLDETSTDEAFLVNLTDLWRRRKQPDEKFIVRFSKDAWLKYILRPELDNDLSKDDEAVTRKWMLKRIIDATLAEVNHKPEPPSECYVNQIIDPAENSPDADIFIGTVAMEIMYKLRGNFYFEEPLRNLPSLTVPNTPIQIVR